jgi:hypothetical protein
MAYYGTTQLSSIANPPIQLAKGMGGLANTTASSIGGTGLWLYSSSNSATEASSGTNSGTFFTDAYYLGFSIGVIGGVSTAGAYMSTGSQTNSTAGA